MIRLGFHFMLLGGMGFAPAGYASAHATNAHTKAAADAVVAAVGHALQADAFQAVAMLRPLPEAALSPADRAFKACMLERFGDNEQPKGGSSRRAAFSDELIGQFRAYWRRALLDPGSRNLAETKLRQSLAGQLDVAANWSEIEVAIRRRLAAKGQHALLGKTGPLRELMVSNRRRDVMERVNLPDGLHRVRVVYLEDFSSLGWGDWATCGRRGAGGWATSDGLYAVTPRYSSLRGEEFRVTFLGHEAQHFADLARFRGILPWELEYRAKLTELAQVETTRTQVLAKFFEDQSADSAHPHGYANRKVLIDLASRVGVRHVSELLTIDITALNAAAHELHRRDTASRLGRTQSEQ